jgi:hypothetical protein
MTVCPYTEGQEKNMKKKENVTDMTTLWSHSTANVGGNASSPPTAQRLSKGSTNAVSDFSHLKLNIPYAKVCFRH